MLDLVIPAGNAKSVGLHSHRIDACIRTSAAGDFAQFIVNVHGLVIQRDNSSDSDRMDERDFGHSKPLKAVDFTRMITYDRAYDSAVGFESGSYVTDDS